MEVQNPTINTNEVIDSPPKAKPKLLFVLIIIVAILVIAGGLFIFRSKGNKQGGSVEPTPVVYFPEADPKIIVELTPLDKAKTVSLSISNFSTDITSIEYELTYQSELKKEGVFGTIKLDGVQTSIQRELTLGTCSSGKCVYPTIIGDKGTLTIKFYSKTGPSRFQKEFTIL